MRPIAGLSAQDSCLRAAASARYLRPLACFWSPLDISLHAYPFACTYPHIRIFCARSLALTLPLSSPHATHVSLTHTLTQPISPTLSHRNQDIFDARISLPPSRTHSAFWSLILLGFGYPSRNLMPRLHHTLLPFHPAHAHMILFQPLAAHIPRRIHTHQLDEHAIRIRRVLELALGGRKTEKEDDLMDE